jgi:hypothetical protein
MENKEWVWDNGVLVEKDIDAWKRQVREAKQRSLENAKLKVFESLLKKL